MDRSGATRGSQRKVTNILYIGAQKQNRAGRQSVGQDVLGFERRAPPPPPKPSFEDLPRDMQPRKQHRSRSRPLPRDLKPVCEADVPRCEGRLALLEWDSGGPRSAAVNGFSPTSG
jgi:hypothetical protein